MSEAGKPVLIFDLDGTILSLNSFPVWVMHLLRGPFPGLSPMQRLVLGARVAALLAGRKLLKHPHGPMKRRLQALWQDATARDAGQAALARLTETLLRSVRPNMRLALEAVRAGRVDAVLATAAAGEYGRHFGQALGFTHILATSEAGAANYVEHVSEAKRDGTLAYLETLGWAERPRRFLTDHEEDTPLVQACGRVLWLGPEAKLGMMHAAAPETEIVPARGMDAESLLAALLH